MPHIIGLVLIAVIAKLAYDFFVKNNSDSGLGRPPVGQSGNRKPGRKNAQQRSGGNLIDISDTWIDTSALPYRSREYPLDNKEFAIYNLLRDMLNPEYHLLCPKVRMADLIVVDPQAENYNEHASRVGARGLDLVLFQPEELTPQLVISVESSDDQRKKQINDQFQEKALASAGIPFIKLDPRNLDPAELREDLRKRGMHLITKP